ncbi:hypothetical protein ABAC402_12100 [Asticcacaulis sp. AC402]|nr:hypothetical protein ABAC402_12100 [Asticcacaulis sp. AC402]
MPRRRVFVGQQGGDQGVFAADTVSPLYLIAPNETA